MISAAIWLYEPSLRCRGMIFSILLMHPHPASFLIRCNCHPGNRTDTKRASRYFYIHTRESEMMFKRPENHKPRFKGGFSSRSGWLRSRVYVSTTRWRWRGVARCCGYIMYVSICGLLTHLNLNAFALRTQADGQAFRRLLRF